MKSFGKTSCFLGTIWGDTLEGFWAGKVVAENMEKCHQLIDEHGGNRCFVQRKGNLWGKTMHFEGIYLKKQ